ncbi:MAG: hypothetical protein GY815_19935 [Gammaproteobacteria bacterium]|nr:hypothetical protein [Gammaproteobacteria bacterium]
MRSSGAGFDPNAWVRKNMHAYATKAYHESYNSLNKALVNAAIVRKGDGIRIDYPATRARLEEMARARSHDPGALEAFEGELRQLEEIDKSTVKVDE